MPIIGVFGLSGVGKSWIIARFAAHTPVLHVQASQLLRDAKAVLVGTDVTSEDLRKGAVLDNQALIIEAFARVCATAQLPIVFDGHCVVDNGDRLLEIPVEVIAGLAITHLIFIEGSPQDIVERRRKDTTRVRPERIEEELAQHQQRAKFVCERYSQLLGLPLTIIVAGDEDAFADALRRDIK